MITNFTHYAPVRFPNGDKSYYFGTNNSELEPGEYVIVDTVSGFEMGIVTSKPLSMELYRSKLELKAIVRKASPDDLEAYEMANIQAASSLKIADREAKKLDLGMTFIDAKYSLDGTKITITYTAEGRVDFRELLRVLASLLKCRIELHQIAPRDKAKSVGGMGICGLPLCCSTFLKSFDGISISRAKNQMLTLNIPKLSGQCGRLKCCLLFEDDMYTEEKKNFPHIGDKIKLETGEYTVSSFNIMSRSIKLVTEDDVQFITLDDYNRILHPSAYKAKEVNKNKDNQSNKQSQNNQQKNQNPNQGKNNLNNNQQRNKEQRNNNQQKNNNQNNQQKGKPQKRQNNDYSKNQNVNNKNKPENNNKKRFNNKND